MENPTRTTDAASAASPEADAVRWYMDPITGRHCTARNAPEAARNLAELSPHLVAIAALPGHALVTGTARQLPASLIDLTFAVEFVLRSPRTGKGTRGERPEAPFVVVQLVRFAGEVL